MTNKIKTPEIGYLKASKKAVRSVDNGSRINFQLERNNPSLYDSYNKPLPVRRAKNCDAMFVKEDEHSVIWSPLGVGEVEYRTVDHNLVMKAFDNYYNILSHNLEASFVQESTKKRKEDGVYHNGVESGNDKTGKEYVRRYYPSNPAFLTHTQGDMEITPHDYEVVNPTAEYGRVFSDSINERVRIMTLNCATGEVDSPDYFGDNALSDTLDSYIPDKYPTEEKHIVNRTIKAINGGQMPKDKASEQKAIEVATCARISDIQALKDEYDMKYAELTALRSEIEEKSKEIDGLYVSPDVNGIQVIKQIEKH